MAEFTPFSLNLGGRLVKYNRPVVMGILNVTPDSFFAGSRTSAADDIARRVETMIAAGADMIDIGGYSSRPGADSVSTDEEIRRIALGMEQIRRIDSHIPVSVDTFRAEVARKTVKDCGVDIVNDISGGDLDSDMFATVAELRVPYILMHMRGNPSNMQSLTDYGNRGVVAEVFESLGKKINELALLGVNDIILDPGFGFAKTLEQNYELMRELRVFEQFKLPLLVGISRKSMLTRLLGITPDKALNATTALNALALDRGASILRVHDVVEAVETVKIYCQLNGINY